MDKMRRLFIAALLLSVFLHSNYLYARVSSALSLDGCIKEALDNNPQIQQAYHTWKAAEYRIKSAKGLPDPNVSYTYFGESIETRAGPQEQKFGAKQTIPFPGKLGLKGEIQAKEAQISKEKYEAAKSEVIKKVKFAFYDLYWLDRALYINEEEKELLEKVERVAQRKYESNLSPQQDVIKLQVELSQIIKKIALMRQNRKSLRARMNRLLNRDVGASIDTITEIAIEDFDYEANDIVEQFKHSGQELRAADLTVEKSEFEKSLAKMDYLPDFTLGYEYIDVGGGENRFY